MPLKLLRLTPDKNIEFLAARFNSVSVTLTLENVSAVPVAYKIKTTAPKNYLVRPSSGIIPSQVVQEVQIVLQPHAGDPQQNKDRFLVQAIGVDESLKLLPRDFWTNVSKDFVEDERISVSFVKQKDDFAASSVGADVALNGPVMQGRSSLMAMAAPPTPGSVTGDGLSGGGRRQLTPAPQGPPPQTPAEFDAKYNELLQYCLAVENQKKSLALKLEAATQQATSSTPGLTNGWVCKNCASHSGSKTTGEGSEIKGSHISSSTTQAGGHHGFDLWQVVAIVVGVVILLKIFNFL